VKQAAETGRLLTLIPRRLTPQSEDLSAPAQPKRVWIDSVLADSQSHYPFRDAEAVRRGGHIAVKGLERFEDQLQLEVLEGGAKLPASRHSRRRSLEETADNVVVAIVTMRHILPPWHASPQGTRDHRKQ
jgi:hypothetical protein